jgi:hypothetical protein
MEEILNNTTTIEIDIWDNEVASGALGDVFGNKMDGDWYVKHDALHKGNLSCCGGSLRACLEQLKRWTDKKPTHEVITVFIDKKENWSESGEKRRPADLDDLLLSMFGREDLFIPADLIFNPKGTDRRSRISWPGVEALKGKLIFVITDATSLNARIPLKEYLDTRGPDAVCFVAPRIKAADEILHIPKFSVSNCTDTFFFNLKYDDRAIGPEIHSSYGVSRVYGSPEDRDTIKQLQALKINFIALYNFRL